MQAPPSKKYLKSCYRKISNGWRAAPPYAVLDDPLVRAGKLISVATNRVAETLFPGLNLIPGSRRTAYLIIKPASSVDQYIGG